MRKKDETITAFAFNTSKKIEDFINERTNNLHKTNQELEAKLLNWWVKNDRDKKFAEYFGIIEAREAKM